jgi:hypothetical protein
MPYRDHQQHDGVVGSHLKKYEKVCIGYRSGDEDCTDPDEIDEVTRVKLGNQERYLILLPDTGELKGASNFDHEKNVKPHLVAIPHLVRIRAAEYKEGMGTCVDDKKKRTILVQFCKVKGKEKCPEPQFGDMREPKHYGDTHAQN